MLDSWTCASPKGKVVRVEGGTACVWEGQQGTVWGGGAVLSLDGGGGYMGLHNPL